ncbi:alpha-tocopherol transfer protein-like [Sitophilus oryzae]|uniref:Alpha-tocopherol transfer protein-like n=1 Tax=Sitophilus oryzae TaxID=7048 RepID=A0A6J2XWK1_SITOR|nr:alpha-tocopherol transfer protein-like [Sitophilus oryzae]
MMCRKLYEKYTELPSPELLQYILNEINESDEEKLQHNETLMVEWIKWQPHFPRNIASDVIRTFLRGTKHNLDRAKRKLENYLSARHLYQEVYLNRFPLTKDILQAMDVVNIASMPKLTKNGCRLLFFSLNITDPSKFSTGSMAKLFFMLSDLTLILDQPVAGHIAVLDAAGMEPAHISRWLGTDLKKGITLMRQAYPFRVKGIHVVNSPPFVKNLSSLVVPLLHQKIHDVIHFHKSYDNIQDTFGTDNIPKEYGGDLKSLRELTLKSYEALQENAGWFETQENVKIVDVPKKIEFNLSHKEFFGVDGSFRQLKID